MLHSSMLRAGISTFAWRNSSKSRLPCHSSVNEEPVGHLERGANRTIPVDGQDEQR